MITFSIKGCGRDKCLARILPYCKSYCIYKYLDDYEINKHEYINIKRKSKQRGVDPFIYIEPMREYIVEASLTDDCKTLLKMIYGTDVNWGLVFVQYIKSWLSKKHNNCYIAESFMSSFKRNRLEIIREGNNDDIK